MRKALNGTRLKEYKRQVDSYGISSKVPGKWVIIDTENGRIYGYNEIGWQEVPTGILEAAEIAICRELKTRNPALRTDKMVCKSADPKFICSWCEHWVPGIKCEIRKSYKQCIKETGWRSDAKKKNANQKASRRKK